jgi:hypothetical protein
MGIFASNLTLLSSTGVFDQRHAGDDEEVVVKSKAVELVNIIRQDSERFKKLQPLADYLERRADAFTLLGSNLNEIELRTKLLLKLTENIGNEKEFSKLLEEKNIRIVKGFFTHEMYDLLVELRDKPTSELKNNLITHDNNSNSVIQKRAAP